MIYKDPLIKCNAVDHAEKDNRDVKEKKDYPQPYLIRVWVSKSMEKKYHCYDNSAEDAQLEENELPTQYPITCSLWIWVFVDFFTVLVLLNVIEDPDVRNCHRDIDECQGDESNQVIIVLVFGIIIVFAVKVVMSIDMLN